jgi:hypothetical protein
MRYVILVKATADSEAGALPGEDLVHAMADYHEELVRAGVLLDAAGLQPSAKGWRVRYDGEERTVVDGPFAEAKELVGGYAILQAKSKEEAIELAKRFMRVHAQVLGSSYEGECEVRQLFDPADFA